MNTRRFNALCLAVILVIAGGAFYYFQYKQKKLAAELEVTNLVTAANSEREELGTLYQKRVNFLMTWKDQSQTLFKKLPPELELSDAVVAQKDFMPKTQEDFVKLDRVQNEVSEDISNYFQNKDAVKKKPEGLEKLEEAINRKRHEYHVKAFAANSLIEKYDAGKTPELPTFEAEKALLKQGLFK